MYNFSSVQLQGHKRSKMGLIEEIKEKIPSLGDFVALRRLSQPRLNTLWAIILTGLNIQHEALLSQLQDFVGH